MTRIAGAFLSFLILLASSAACLADRLYLRGGEVKVGKVVKKDADSVHFRITMQGGKLTLVKRYRAADIVKIEEGDQTEVETGTSKKEPAETSGKSEDDSTESESKASLDDKPAFLEEALDKVKTGKIAPGLRDLTRLVYACSDKEDELAELSGLCKKRTGQALDEFLAKTRLEEVLEKSKGRSIRLSITKYERGAMSKELRAVIQEHCAKKIGGTTIDDEIAAPDKYRAEPEDAKEFYKHVTQTLAYTRELVKLEPSQGAESKATRGRRSDKADGDRTQTDQPDEGKKDAGRKSSAKTRDAVGGEGYPTGKQDGAGHAATQTASLPAKELQAKLIELQKAARAVSRGQIKTETKRYGDKDDTEGDQKQGRGGRKAPDFELRDLAGRPVRLSEFKGSFVLLDFWATWCQPCVQELPSLVDVFRSFGRDRRFVMISLSLDRDPETLRQFVGQHQLEWIQVYLEGKAGDAVKQDYGVKAIPSIFLIDPEGNILEQGLRGREIKAAVGDALTNWRPSPDQADDERDPRARRREGHDQEELDNEQRPDDRRNRSRRRGQRQGPPPDDRDDRGDDEERR
ncbi:MAG: TlpA family protein disulfide reductase [Phycisphaerae bacterium]|nr:TlpA family protein disulfide reductase [Phycisphaerae bacterium]